MLNLFKVNNTGISCRSQMFFKIGVRKNFSIFTGKRLCWSLFKPFYYRFRLLKIFPRVVKK